MRILIHILLSSLVLISAEASADESTPQYVTYLIPVFYNGPGSGGSVWETELWIENRGQEPAGSRIGWYDAPDCRFAAPCPVAIPARTLYQPPVEYFFGRRSLTGLLFYPTEKAASHLWFSLRVRDRAHDASSAGVDVPVVHEKEFRDRELILLNVPTDPRFRSTLRIYALSTKAEPVQLRYRSMESDDVIAEETVLTSFDQEENSPDFPLSPSYAELSGMVSTHPSLQMVESYRIEIDADARMWAFVSLTNSQTGQVTLVTPQ